MTLMVGKQKYKQLRTQTRRVNKATAKAKLIAGQALTEDEANTIVL